MVIYYSCFKLLIPCIELEKHLARFNIPDIPILKLSSDTMMEHLQNANGMSIQNLGQLYFIFIEHSTECL